MSGRATGSDGSTRAMCDTTRASMSRVAVLSAALDTFRTATGAWSEVSRKVWSRSLPRLTAPSATTPKHAPPMAAASASSYRGGCAVSTASIASIRVRRSGDSRAVGQQLAGVLLPRGVHHGDDRAGLDHPPLLQDLHPCRDGAHQREVVGDEQHADAALLA